MVCGAAGYISLAHRSLGIGREIAMMCAGICYGMGACVRETHSYGLLYGVGWLVGLVDYEKASAPSGRSREESITCPCSDRGHAPRSPTHSRTQLTAGRYRTLTPTQPRTMLREWWGQGVCALNTSSPLEYSQKHAFNSNGRPTSFFHRFLRPQTYRNHAATK